MDAERTPDEANDISDRDDLLPDEGDSPDEPVEKGGDGHQTEPPVAGPAGS